ncbi:hypothetical protein WBP06_09415 [Novosphingobium sp. BL-8H]|uniref:hypothetical protein n=1 Tax=Novosphingobium sp. BL-8H TaxID=3127640 RepID=UPI003757B7D4
MTEIDTDKLRALDEAAVSETIVVRQHSKANADAKNKALDRVKLSNQIGPLGSFERTDGELLALLWNNRGAILAMAEENARLREALERCAQIVERNNHRQNEKVDDVVVIARRALSRSGGECA